MKIRKILPQNAADPSNLFPLIKGANREITKRFTAIQSGLWQLIKRQKQHRKIGTNVQVWRSPTEHERLQRLAEDESQERAYNSIKKVLATNDYVYELSATRYTEINSFIDGLIKQYILDGDTASLERFWLSGYINQSYEQSVNDLVIDIQNMAPIDAVGESLFSKIQQITGEQMMFSAPVMNRLALQYARTYNLMKGLTEQMKADLGETLTRAMLDGVGIPEIAKRVNKRLSVGMTRAMRIARTEIPNTYRTAKMDETREMNETTFKDEKWQMRLLWWSALAPTTRPWHAKRHAGIYTHQEVKKFYSEGANSIQCLCTQSPILVNTKTGDTLEGDLRKRMTARKNRWLGVAA